MASSRCSRSAAQPKSMSKFFLGVAPVASVIVNGALAAAGAGATGGGEDVVEAAGALVGRTGGAVDRAALTSGPASSALEPAG